MSRVHYTRHQVLGLLPAITDMVRDVVRDVFGKHIDALKKGESKRETYKLITDKVNNETVDFSFVISPNPLDRLTNRDEVTDIKAWENRPIITATTFLNGRSCAIAFYQKDLDKSLEEALSDPSIDAVSQHLLDHILTGMAAAWYNHGLHDRISLWNHESNFEAIDDYSNGLIRACWNEKGYAVTIFSPENDNGNLVVLKRNESYNTIPRHFDSANKNVDICQRYIDQGVVSLITMGLIEKDFSWTLN